MKLHKHKITTFIFDFDGTLVDSEPNHYEAFVKSLKEIGINYVSYPDHLKIYTGTGSRFIFTKELEKHGKNIALLDKLLESKSKYYKEAQERNNTSQIPGATDFLNHAKKSGYKLALVSGGGLKDIKRVMVQAGIPDVFEIYITQDDKYKPKPDPEGFLLAAKKLGSEPKECIVFEDALNGIKGAIAAKMTPIALTTYISQSRFQEISPDLETLENYRNLEIE